MSSPAILPVTASDFHAAEGLEDWRVVGDGAALFVRTNSFAASVRLAQAIAEIPGVDGHPPAIDIRANGVTSRLITTRDDYYGMSETDVDLARGISAVVRELGFSADPSAVQSILVVPGAPDTAAVAPFWRAVLGYVPRPDSPDDDLVDLQDRGPAFWFEEMDEPRADGGGAIHVAIWVPPDQAEARVKGALAAGGRIVRDRAPSWWTLADPAGNEADIATVAGRD
jgi:4a-hydroxytetrahydrobiopterin dehydratase